MKKKTSISDKLQICQQVKNGQNLQNVAEEYGVGKSTDHIFPGTPPLFDPPPGKKVWAG